MPQPFALSNDGSYVFFQSATGLTPNALDDVTVDAAGNKAINVYEYHDGEVSLISDGQDITVAEGPSGSGSNVRLLGTSASGADVFFTTGDQIVSQDVDTQVDVYDARIEGGFPRPATPPACSGESCQGLPLAPPAQSVPGSSHFQGPGNPARKRHHKKQHHGGPTTKSTGEPPITTGGPTDETSRPTPSAAPSPPPSWRPSPCSAPAPPRPSPQPPPPTGRSPRAPAPPSSPLGRSNAAPRSATSATATPSSPPTTAPKRPTAARSRSPTPCPQASWRPKSRGSTGKRTQIEELECTPVPLQCTTERQIPPDDTLEMTIKVEVTATGTVTNEASV